MLSTNWNLSKEELGFQFKQQQLAHESIRQDSIFRTTQINQLERSVTRLRSNYSIVKETLDRLTIKSPMNGQLTAFDVEIGQSINQRQRIGQIDKINQYKAETYIDEHYLPKLHTNQKAIGYNKGQEIELVVKKIYPLVQNGRVKIDLSFSNNNITDLTRGQRLQLKLELSGANPELLLKRGSFFNESGGSWVFVREKGKNIFTKRTIQLGRQNPNYFVIKDGLSEGDEVIISNYSSYKNIDTLEI